MLLLAAGFQVDEDCSKTTTSTRHLALAPSLHSLGLF